VLKAISINCRGGLTGNCKTPQNIHGTKEQPKQAFHTLWGNVDLTILPACKGNAMVILNITDCMEVMSLLVDPVYKKLARDPTQSMEWRTTPSSRGPS